MSKKRMAIIGVLGLTAVLTLTACTPTSGKIENKRERDGYYYPVQVGKVMVLEYAPPSYCLDLYGSNGSHGWRCVDYTTYNHAKIGQYYSGN